MRADAWCSHYCGTNAPQCSYMPQAVWIRHTYSKHEHLHSLTRSWIVPWYVGTKWGLNIVLDVYACHSRVSARKARWWQVIISSSCLHPQGSHSGFVNRYVSPKQTKPCASNDKGPPESVNSLIWMKSHISQHDGQRLFRTWSLQIFVMFCELRRILS